MNDHNRAYEVQIRELYLMGRFLANQKYRFVRYAYITFASGLIVSSMVFVIKQLSEM